MKAKKSTLELTPLLDVVLIILFVFMMMLANQVNESNRIKEESEDKVAQTEQELDVALQANAEKDIEIEELTKDYEELKQSSQDTAQLLEEQQAVFDEQQKTAENLAKAVAEFIKADEKDMEKLLDDNKDSPSDKLLTSVTSTEDIAEELLKFEAISRQFYFIDLELKTSDNRLYINGDSTSLGISYEQSKDDDIRKSKVNEIKDIIEEDMETRQGGSQMVFITLKVSDRDVYQYAWQVVWDAIGEIQEKYGTDKVFRTHITIIKN